MKASVCSPSNKHSCGKTTVPSRYNVSESAYVAPEDKFALQSLLQTASTKASHFYYGVQGMTFKDELSSCGSVKMRGESPQRLCASCSVHVSGLSAAYAKLHAEAENLRSANSALRHKNGLMSASLANLSTQFNCTLAAQQSVQKHATALKRDKVGLQQRIAFFEQKLEQCITKSFSHEQRADDLVEELSNTSRAYEAQISLLKSQIRTHHSMHQSRKLSNVSTTSSKCISKTFALTNGAQCTRTEATRPPTAHDCLFKDKCAGEDLKSLEALVMRNALEM